MPIPTSGSAYHHQNEQNTHGKAMCPRLAMCMCMYCKQNGHTTRFCPKKRCDETMNAYPASDDGEEFILDFDSLEGDSDVIMT